MQNETRTRKNPSNLYQILGLVVSPSSAANISTKQIKEAYRLSLLQHHPDKVTSLSSQSHRWSIDQIVEAHRILSEPSKKAAYDLDFCRQFTQTEKEARTRAHAGREHIDLGDFTFDDSSEVWKYPCRCGDPLGYQVNEQQLEDASNDGELLVPCAGCSLYVVVAFEVDST